MPARPPRKGTATSDSALGEGRTGDVRPPRRHARAQDPSPDQDAVGVCAGCGWRWPCPSAIAGRELAAGDEGEAMHDLVCELLSETELQALYRELQDGTAVDTGERNNGRLTFALLPEGHAWDADREGSER